MKLRLEIDIAKIRQNVLGVRARTGVGVLLMVKADAYGHGMLPVSLALDGDVGFFGVATLEEGCALRDGGVKSPVLVALSDASDLPLMAGRGLTAAIRDTASLAALAALPPEKRPCFHIKADTGMHRLGMSPAEAISALDFMRGTGLAPSGVYSHFAEPDPAQAELFGTVAAAYKRVFPDAVAHMASSSSLDLRGELDTMVRIGHAAYAGAMTVKSEVIAVRKVRAGERVGYAPFRLDADAVVAVVFGGYFDGVDRRSPSPVVIGGRVCPVLGSVCMDMFAVRAFEGVRVGDEVTLLGEGLDAATVARARGVSDYEVTTCWHGRVERIYNDEGRGEKESGCCRRQDERG